MNVSLQLGLWSDSQKDPYTMLKESSKQRVGNDRYEGICVDLIDELSKSLGFNYSFHTNPDDSPGSPDANGNWNGMIGELLDGVSCFLISTSTSIYVICTYMYS